MECIKQKRKKKRIYPSLRELRKDLEEFGEDSKMEEDFTKDEEEKIVELMGKHSLRTPEKQRPKMVTAK